MSPRILREEADELDLFEYQRRRAMEAEAPLAARMRPKTLAEYTGQEHLLGPGKFLRRAIEAGRLPSCIFYGPPGTGKTSLARLAAELAKTHFEQLNAVTAGVADIRRVVEEARARRGEHAVKTTLFIDEIHRFNKSQQDALLPYVEEGLLTLVGATTQNPLVAVNPALVSRVRLFELQPLSPDAVRELLLKALAEPGRGLGNYSAELEPAALDHLVRLAGGDVRTALNALELAVTLTEPDPSGCRRVTRAAAEEALQQRAIVYDESEHYHVISAFIKSLRGSDPDAAVYYLARMLHAGEDIRFIGRRLVIFAAEDVGNADPSALPLAVAASQAAEMVGMPEARIPLAQAVTYLASTVKSNAAYNAVNRALEEVSRQETPPVPNHLRDPGYGAGKRLGYGQGYLYPHDYPSHFVAQEYLPEPLRETIYYQPSDQGREVKLAERLNFLRSQRPKRG